MSQRSHRLRFAAPVFLLIVASTLVFTGCATSSNIVQLSPDTYQVSVKGGNGSVLKEPDHKARAVSEAMEFAAARGKAALPITLRSRSYGLFEDLVTVEYQFRLVDKNDPQLKRNEPKPDEPPKVNIYVELDKLEDLRKRGIITQAEFVAEKQKLLSR